MITFIKQNEAKYTHKQSNETKRNKTKWAMLPEGTRAKEME